MLMAQAEAVARPLYRQERLGHILKQLQEVGFVSVAELSERLGRPLVADLLRADKVLICLEICRLELCQPRTRGTSRAQLVEEAHDGAVDQRENARIAHGVDSHRAAVAYIEQPELEQMHGIMSHERPAHDEGRANAPAQIAQFTGSLGGILCVWGLGGVIALTGAFVFAELGVMFPRTGGEYVFVKEPFGRFPAFMFGWLMLAAIVSNAVAFVATVFADHLEVIVKHFGAAGFSSFGAP